MIRELTKSVREYKKYAIATPILVSLEVVMAYIIPFLIAGLALIIIYVKWFAYVDSGFYCSAITLLSYQKYLTVY